MFAIAAAAALAMMLPPSAAALSQRGHVSSGTVEASGSGALSKPGAIAVSDSTGDVYVVDRREARIVVYGPSGEFLSTWGWGVNKGSSGKEYEVCTSNCQAGTAGRGDYQFNNFTLAVAVDNCTTQSGTPCNSKEDPSVGDVYVLKEYADKEQATELREAEHEKHEEIKAEEKALKTKFSEDEHEAREHAFSEYLAISKLSPDGARLEELADNEEACEFEGKYKTVGNEANGGPLACELELETSASHGLGVGVDGTPLLYYEEELRPLNRSHLSEPDDSPAISVPVSSEIEEGVNGGVSEAANGLTYIGQSLSGPTGPLDVMSERQLSGTPKEPELEELIEELDAEQTTGVAVNTLDIPAEEVDEQNDAYITNVKTEQGKQTSSIAQFDSEGHLIQRFTAAGLQEAAGIAINSTDGQVYVPDAASNTIDVFTLEPPAAPTIDSESALEVEAESAHLNASVDPRGAETQVAFRYSTGTVPRAGEPCASPCVETAVTTTGSAFSAQAAAATLKAGTSTPIAPGTTYHFRAIAENAKGTTEGAEQSFSTPPTSGRFMADERVWELVSPADKGGADVEPISETGGLVQASSNGNAITYITNAPFGEAEGSRTYEVTQLLACSTREAPCASANPGAEGWATHDIVTPNEHGAGTGPTSTSSEYQFFAEDLALALVKPWRSPEFGEHAELKTLAEPPLTPAATASEREHGQEKTVYLRSDAPVKPEGEPQTEIYEQAQANAAIMKNPGYLALITDANVVEGAKFGAANATEFLDATPNLASVIIESHLAATHCEATEFGCSPGLFEWSHGSIQPVSVLPCETEPCTEMAPEPKLGDHSQDRRRAISANGSRVFWDSNLGTGQHLYMRSTASIPGKTIQLDRIQGGTGEGRANAVFQDANTEGSKVFFTDEQALTANAAATTGRPDLYECEITESAGKAKCNLSDLTPPISKAHPEPAAVQGALLGASEDGTAIYYVADAALTETANREDQTPIQGNCRRGDATAWLSATEEGRRPREASCNLYLETYNSKLHEWSTTFIATLSEADAVDWEAGRGASGFDEFGEVTARVSPNGQYVAFMSDMPLTSYDGQAYDNNASNPNADSLPAEETYEYRAPSETERTQGEQGLLICASCDPSGSRPKGLFDPTYGATGRGEESLLVDRPRAWSAHWLAGSIPTYTRAGQLTPPYALYQSRYLSSAGRLYFDSPEDLVPEATNGKEDVYEFEPVGTPRGKQQCTAKSATYSPRNQGCIGLLSSGTASQESAFLDASETGGEGPGDEELQEGGSSVFFVTSQPLTPQETEATFSLYDAHECTNASPCVVPREEKPPPPCETTEACRIYTPEYETLGNPESAPPNAPGNLAAPTQAPTNTSSRRPPRRPTRKQLLIRALRTCRSHDRRSRRHRTSCERQAFRRYGRRRTRHR
ncbi:MAG TPA: hypothetical protein VMA83_00155 [Solirubrobacteraceae bacterium]|nr:hypothetical protein [Solirubrobacteraceae bacterium]